MGDLAFKRIAAHLERWFEREQRELPWRLGYDPYHVWVSEVMLQQTRMEVVVPYFLRFIERFPNVAALAAASIDEVTSAWSGLGYYRRARMLHEGARVVLKRSDGNVPETIDELRAIPGIGRYTAGAISSIAFDHRAAIVDGNVARVASRLALLDAPSGSRELESDAWLIAEALVMASKSPRMLNQALMELGARICTPRNPKCDDCPIARLCGARAADVVSEYPRPPLPKRAIELEVPLYLVRDGKRFLLERHQGRLMGGMFHLPHGSAALTTDSSERFTAVRELGKFIHTITNRRVTFRLHEAEARTELRDVAESVWASESELQGYPHPSYVRKALKLARQATEKTAPASPKRSSRSIK